MGLENLFGGNQKTPEKRSEEGPQNPSRRRFLGGAAALGTAAAVGAPPGWAEESDNLSDLLRSKEKEVPESEDADRPISEMFEESREALSREEFENWFFKKAPVSEMKRVVETEVKNFEKKIIEIKVLAAEKKEDKRWSLNLRFNDKDYSLDGDPRFEFVVCTIDGVCENVVYFGKLDPEEMRKNTDLLNQVLRLYKDYLKAPKK